MCQNTKSRFFFRYKRYRTPIAIGFRISTIGFPNPIGIGFPKPIRIGFPKDYENKIGFPIVIGFTIWIGFPMRTGFPIVRILK